MARRSRGGLPLPEIGSLLPSAEVTPPATINGVAGTETLEIKAILEHLPALMTAKQLAALLDVSPETIRRRIRNGRQTTVQLLGIKRIPIESAAEQVRARIVKHLPARFRSKPIKGAARQVAASPCAVAIAAPADKSSS